MLNFGSRQVTTLKVCLWSALACALLLFLVLDLQRMTLRVPLYYFGDGYYMLSLVKAIHQGDWIWNNTQIGMPFGAETRDYAVYFNSDACLMWLLTRFSSQPGTVMNLFWILSVMLTAASASYGLLRFSFSPWVAGALGVIYALQPYTFFRNEQHIVLVAYFVPLIATAVLELALGRIQSARSVPIYAWLGLILQGFDYIYYSFYAGFFLVTAILLAYAARRNRAELAAGGVLLGALILATTLNLMPSLTYWAQHPKAESVKFKRAYDADTYGLKLRHMLQPTSGNPLPPLRRISEAITSVGFPLENENNSARLGTVLAVGLIVLLIYLLLSPLGRTLLSEDYIGPCAALLFAGFLFATIGGLGSLFNTFVTADFRGYNRVVIFLSFFCALASGALVQRAWASLLGREWPPLLLMVGMSVFVLWAATDQTEPSLLTDYNGNKSRFDQDEEIVRKIETTLPSGASVLQLPYRPFPSDPPDTRMGSYDQARPYLHAQHTRWSWGSIDGLNADWNRRIAAEPVPAMLSEACYAGFQGVWLDQFGYSQSPIAVLRAEAGPEKANTPDGRIYFFDIRPACAKLGPPPGTAHPLFAEGFYATERQGGDVWHWCKKEGVLVVKNDESRTRHVEVSLEAITGHSEATAIHVETPDGMHSLLAGQHRVPWSTQLTLPPDGVVRLHFSSEAHVFHPPNDPRDLYFALYSVNVKDR